MKEKLEEEPPSSLLIKKSSIKDSFKLGTWSVEVFHDINQCFELWQEFSPKRNLFETWEFRFAFYEAYKYEPYFMVLKNKNERVALLPLWYDSDRKKYFWFGSDWQEEVRFFAKKPEFVLPLISLAPSPLFLNAICEESILPIKEKLNFELDEPKYVLDLKNFKGHEDYLMCLTKNVRRDLRKDKRKILDKNPEIIFNNFSDFEFLVKLAKKRFKEKGEETDWEDPRRIEAFRNVIKFAGKSYKIRMITVKIDEKIAGVDLICLFNGTYYAVKCGYDVENFPGIGNFINLFEIDDAKKLGMEKIDFLQNSYEWKDRYFDPIPLYKYEK